MDFYDFGDYAESVAISAAHSAKTKLTVYKKTVDVAGLLESRKVVKTFTKVALLEDFNVNGRTVVAGSQCEVEGDLTTTSARPVELSEYSASTIDRMIDAVRDAEKYGRDSVLFGYDRETVPKAIIKWVKDGCPK